MNLLCVYVCMCVCVCVHAHPCVHISCHVQLFATPWTIQPTKLLCPWNFFPSKNIQWGKDSIFHKWCWENLTATCKRMKLEHFLTPYTQINSKWFKDLNVRPQTVKLLEENTGKTLDDINQSKILYDPPPRVVEIKTKVSTWDLIKLKSFAQQRKL